MFEVARSPRTHLAVLIIVLALLTSQFISREVAHFVGMGGIVVLFTEILRHGSLIRVTGLPLARGCAILTGGVGVVVVANHLGLVGRGLGALAVFAMLLLTSFGVLARQIYQLRWFSHPAPVAALIVLSASIHWELIFQPSISVYSKGPRGSVEWPQVGADFAGILLAYIALRKVRMREGGERPTSNTAI